MSHSHALRVINRRSFARTLFVAGVGLFGAPVFGGADEADIFDFVIVGAGAGGGPLAAGLANAGFKVALIDAGLDPAGVQAQIIDPATGILYQVPAFAAAAAENPLLSWDFYVDHYADPVQQARDSKFVPGKGILYPRGSCLGGSTAHNVMNWVRPHDDDWNGIAEITGDGSWSAPNMRKIFERVEKCEYCQPLAPGHGMDGYIPASRVDSQMFEFGSQLRELATAGQTPSSSFPGDPAMDINNPAVAAGGTGSFLMTEHVATNVRVSVREHLAATQQAHPDRLFLITGALATKALFEGRRAIGVEFMQGANLYQADKLYDPAVVPVTHRIHARREVVLSAGVFNTPQLLKLSGIGPAAELRSHGIEVKADLPGVGENMQDRYELTVSARLKQKIQPYATCQPGQMSDPCLKAWSTGQFPGDRNVFYGPYAFNGVLSARIARSQPSRKLPDLFVFGGVTGFNGYAPGYSQSAFADQRFTWLILKAHTNNHAGTVRLRSTDPRHTPRIDFHYFEEGTDASGDDLNSVVKGIEIARSFLSSPQAQQHIDHEIVPGSQIQTTEDLKTYIRNEAWGHHASCTAKIGAKDDPMAVLDSGFRVRKVQGLRVVDACAFPRIPGFFPVAAIMMLGEKASDVILQDHKSSHRDA